MLFQHVGLVHHDVGTHVCKSRGRFDLRHLSRIQREPLHADFKVDGVNIPELIRQDARQNCFPAAHRITIYHWRLSTQLSNFQVLFGARLLIGDHEFLEPYQPLYQRHIFRMREHGLNLWIRAHEQSQQHCAQLRPQHWILLVRLRIAE
jgi:hypothetical protein